MSAPVVETKPADEQVLKEEPKQETSTTSEEVQMTEEKEAAAELSTTTESSTTAEPSTTAESTGMEVDSSLNETKPEATSGEETKPVAEADGTKSDNAKANNFPRYRLNGASSRRFKWLVDQGYPREEAVQLAKEPLQTKELRDRYIADTKKAKEEKGDNFTRYRLNGASSKRFRWLLDQGYPREEASQLAKEPLKTKELRDRFSADTKKAKEEKEALKMACEPMNATAAKRSPSANGGPPSKVSKPSPEAAGGIVMAVACRDYPATSLTNEQTDEVKSAILKEVLQQDFELEPRFESCIHVKGYLRVHCSDQDTCQWLQRVVAKLAVPEGISLKMVDERNVFKGDIYTGYFTDSRNDTNEAILEFVKRQNDGIDTSKWKILTRKEVENKQTIELIFTVDQSSAKSIHNLGYELNYKLNKIKIRKHSKSSDTPAAGNKNVRTDDMAPPQRRPFNQPRPKSNFIVPVWDRNPPQRRSDNNFNQFSNPRNTFSSGSGNSRNHGRNSFGLGGGGSGSFGMGNGGGNNSFGGNGHSNSFGGNNSIGRSNSFGGSNSNFDTVGRGGNQNSNRPLHLNDSLYDQLGLIGSGGGDDSNQNNNSFGSSRRSGGGNNGGNRQWGQNTFYNLGNSSSYSGRSNSSQGN